MRTNERSAIRRRAGLTQLQLSRLTKISAPRISLWENGEIDLPAEEVQRLAKALTERLNALPVVTEDMMVDTLSA